MFDSFIAILIYIIQVLKNHAYRGNLLLWSIILLTTKLVHVRLRNSGSFHFLLKMKSHSKYDAFNFAKIKILREKIWIAVNFKIDK